MDKRENFDCHTVEEGLAFVERKLKELRIQKQIYNQDILVTEELLTKIFQLGGGHSVRIKTLYSFGEYSIRFIFPCGVPFELINDEDETDIGGRILSHYAERIRTKYRSGTMTVTVLVEQSYTRYARLSMIAVLLAIVSALLLTKFAPQELRNFMENRLLWLIESIFTKAICLIATPVTFFCIASNIANCSGLSDRYPNVKKLVARYMSTSVVAVIIGYLIFLLIRPLLSGIVFPEYQLKNAVMVNVSDIWLAIYGIVPESILYPFSSGATLPTFFLAAISGVAVAALDRQTGQTKERLDAIRDLFCKMLAVIFHFSPIIVFLCVFELIIYHGLIVLLYQMLCIVAGILCCFAIAVSYTIPLAISRISPIRLLRVMWRSFWNAFLIGSAEDAIPDTIKDCSEKLNLPKRPLEVAIPLGAEFNMDGNCGVQMLLVLILAEISGMELSIQTILIVGLFILAIAFGAPSQPGSITVGVMIILPQIGLSTQLVTTALLIEIATSRFLTMTNVIGDVVCAELIGERERRRMQKWWAENEKVSDFHEHKM